MKYNIITLFPEMFESVFDSSIIGKAISNNIIKINTIALRDFCKDKHKTADDTPFGGGPGMLMKPEPLALAINHIKDKSETTVVYASAGGKKFDHKCAKMLAQKNNITFICGHYEGIDQRIIDKYVDYELSVGDYILTGGEIPTMLLIDSISRFVPNVIGNENSIIDESFSKNLLEYPQYTRPREFEDIKVPDELLSGNHKEIEKWRNKKALEKTSEKRPDLIKIFHQNLYLAIIHYPIKGKDGKTCATSITNLDIHDIARAARTYGAKKVFFIHPNKSQRDFANDLLNHWKQGFGASYNPDRKDAVELIHIKHNLNEAIKDIEKTCDNKPLILATSAIEDKKDVSFKKIEKQIFENPCLLLFGTGWGLEDSILEKSDYKIEPIKGTCNYNHLSIRSAVSITLDRMFK
ncbi:MAG: tRNA (guanosine(37)-N1)-methyltransferase TrmD [Pseudomonadota bacterium]